MKRRFAHRRFVLGQRGVLTSDSVYLQGITQGIFRGIEPVNAVLVSPEHLLIGGERLNRRPQGANVFPLAWLPTQSFLY